MEEGGSGFVEMLGGREREGGRREGEERERQRGREAGGRGESLGVTSKVIHALPEARPLKNIPGFRV